MMKIINLSKNLLALVGVSGKDEMIVGNKFSKTNKILFKTQKSNLKILSKSKIFANLTKS